MKLFPQKAAAVAVAAALSALAQANANTVLEETVVIASSIKQMEAAAVETKRESNNVVDAISADTIGRFPDQNLADSLARVPGVAIERDQGQARYVNLRGAPFRYTAIAFDGIDVPGAENGRIPRFDSFPAVITRQLKVNKAIMANMPGEAVSGFVDIETHSPFDKEGYAGAFDLGFGKQDLGDGDVDKYAVRGSWSGENFGVLGFASENNREQITDNREFDYGLTDGGEKILNEVDFRSYKIKRSDKSYGGTLEYRGEGTVKRVFASTLYSEFVDEEERNQFVITMLAPQAGLTAEGVPARVNRLLEDGVYQNSTFVNTLGAEFEAAGFNVNARYSRTETEFVQDLPIIYQAAGFESMGADGPLPYIASYNLSSESNPLVYLNNVGGQTANPANSVFFANLGYAIYNPLDQQVNKYKLDLDRDLQLFGGDTNLAFGVQFDDRKADGGAMTAAISSFPVDVVNINDYDTGVLWDSNTTNTIGGTYYDNPGLDRAWRESGFYPADNVAEENIVKIDEQIFAAYAMTTTEYSWGSFVAGVRVEQTDVDNTGNNGTYSDSFTNVLPNAHLNYNLTDDSKLRVSFSSGVNRPTYNEWRASASLNPIDQEVSGGNPALQAEESYGFDVSYEYYLESGGLFSAAYFYRVVDNVIYADVTSVDAGNYSPDLAGQQWQYIGFVNGSDGEFTGVELNAVVFLDDLVEGLGVSANATFAQSEYQTMDGTVRDLPGTSDSIYNMAVFYENFGFSARFNYSYRDEWISPIEDPEEYWGAMERLDAQLSYTLPEGWLPAKTEIYANFNNLTEETDVRYAGNGTINQSESYGMHYLLGLRIDL